MKQSALVIATLFAAAQAAPADAKARMERDIRGYLSNGLKFDKKVLRAIHGDVRRVAEARAEFNEEARENWAEGHEVWDEYIDAIKYEKSQETVTKPSKANGQWGNIHYNNPQKIMDKWVAAVEHDQELGEEWQEDWDEYMARVNRSHEILGKQVDRAWETNGVKAHDYAQAAMRNAGEAWKASDKNAPKSLAVDSSDVANDAKQFFTNVHKASEAVRHTYREAGEADRVPDREIDRATVKYIQQREKINAGYARAMEFEIKNTHLDKGLPGGEGKLWWSKKQGIVDRWAKPMEAQKKAEAEWKAKVGRALEQKQKI